MQFTLTQAAQLFGKNKTTIHRAMASGRLSYTLSPEGKRLIDMSELIRVYGEPATDATQNATVQPSPESADATDATELLTVMRAMLVEMQGMRRELSEIKEQQKLLPPPQPTSPSSDTDANDHPSGSDSSSAPSVDDADPHGFRATLRNIFSSKE